MKGKIEIKILLEAITLLIDKLGAADGWLLSSYLLHDRNSFIAERHVKARMLLAELADELSAIKQYYQKKGGME